MSHTCLLIIWSLFLVISNGITIIDSIWNDDFLMDSHSINGWTRNDTNTYTLTHKYHVWFVNHTHASLRRQFQCSQTSHIQISFTIYSECNTEPQKEGFELHFNTQIQLLPDTAPHRTHFLSNDSNLLHTQCQSIFAQDMDISIANITIIRLQTFSIEFIITERYSGSLALSNIRIQCLPLVTDPPQTVILYPISTTQDQHKTTNAKYSPVLITIFVLIGVLCGGLCACCFVMWFACFNRKHKRVSFLHKMSRFSLSGYQTVQRESTLEPEPLSAKHMYKLRSRSSDPIQDRKAGLSGLQIIVEETGSLLDGAEDEITEHDTYIPTNAPSDTYRSDVSSQKGLRLSLSQYPRSEATNRSVTHGSTPMALASPDLQRSSLSAVCTGNDTRNCVSCVRIIDMLVYHHQLDIVHSNEHRTQFATFCRSYNHLLDDYVHIITKHNSQYCLDQLLERYRIVDEMFNVNTQRMIGMCKDIDTCASCIRHWKGKQEEGMDDVSDDFAFYRDIIDQIHCFIFHLFDAGLRVRMDVKINQAIKQKLPVNCQKFEINTTYQNQNTFMDGLYEFMNEHPATNAAQMNHMQHWLDTHEYDSEAIEDDIDLRTGDHGEQSNLKQYLNDYNIDWFDRIKQYIYRNKRSLFTFSIGYRFYYWRYYQDKKEYYKDLTGGRNENDHLGHKPFELFVQHKYRNLRDEILCNTLHTLTVYQYSLTLHKAAKYIFSNRIKQMVYKYEDTDDDLHYDIKSDTTPTLEHVLGVCLYCDWTDLCTSFRSTFRKQSSYESIQSVIKRNSEFAHWSRLLREMVELYGKQYPKDKKDVSGVKGPFFCGLSNLVYLPQFDIRLNGPTSTSKQIEIAQHFGGDDGIVLHLNNDASVCSTQLRSFDCTFISKYASENEWLFCGGRFGLKLENIRLQKTNETFPKYCRALFYFDALLNGTDVFMEQITIKDCQIVDNLVKYKLMDVNDETRIPAYIMRTFNAFTEHKTQLVINLQDIARGLYNNEGETNMSKWILYSSEDRKYILRRNVFVLFPNIQRIVMYSATYDKKSYEYVEYTFNVAALLDELNESAAVTRIRNGFEIVIKATHKYGKNQRCNGRSWLYGEYKRNKSQFKRYNTFLCQLKHNTTWDPSIKEDTMTIQIKQ